MRISDWSSDVCSSDLRVVDGLQGSLLQVDVAEIVLHEAYQPNVVVDFLDSEALSGQGGRDVDFLAVHADAPAACDEQVAVVERVVDLRSEEHTSELQSLMRISYAVFCLKQIHIYQ